MVMEDYVQAKGGPDYSILATDLSTDVLRVAKRGIFSAAMIEPVDQERRKRYVMEPRDPARGEVRIHPKLRAKVGFARLNLMDTSYGVGDAMQVIFCRNVLIYFDKKTQEKVLTRLCDKLVPGGYLYVGHSETITGFRAARAAGGKYRLSEGLTAMAKKIRVLVVDDSASVRQALTQVLEAMGDIEVMGVASDPFVAARRIQEEVPDVVTLDVEMPKMDGITFLRKLMAQHPIPVVMCSSLTEAGSQTLMQALEAGAVDVILKRRSAQPTIWRKRARPSVRRSRPRHSPASSPIAAARPSPAQRRPN